MRSVFHLIGAALFACACSGAPAARAQEPSAAPRVPTISVSGDGQVTGRPDVLTVDLGVSLLRPDTQAAIDAAAVLAQRMIDALKAAGVAEPDIQTRDYRVQPEVDYSGQRRRVLGYRVTNVLSVKIRDLARAGPIIDQASAVGAESVAVEGMRFGLEDNEELVRAARAEAWADARSKAEQLAQLAGVNLGRPVQISETFAARPPPMPLLRTAMAEAATTPIEPGELGVTVSLRVDFEIGAPGS